jgi:hypothetical protein
MFTAVSTKPAFSQHVKMIVIAAILALSLLVGTAATTPHVGAEKPKAGQTAATNARSLLQTVCVQLDADQWYFLTGEHIDAGGFYCFKV